MRPRILLILLSTIIPLQCVAKDPEGHYTILSLGTKTCGQVVSDFKEGHTSKIVNSVRLGGFLTAYNFYITGVRDISGNTDPAAWDLWINNYCEKNPLDHLANAAEALVDELKSRQ